MHMVDREAGFFAPLSVLDLVPVGSGSDATRALQDSVRLAREAERWGYRRYWLAEHHGMPSIASSSPEILIAHIAAATDRIRVGSGGMMLQNHVPLKLAEAFHTLEALHPGRIDLGIGRAPGTDPATSQALRPFPPERFREQLAELLALSERTFPLGHPFHRVRVIPEGVELPPIWILGSSGASAELAGTLGMGYAFASHFSPTPAGPALEAYRAAFVPTARRQTPHAILAVSVVCAETEEEADHLAATGDLVWVRLQRGEFGLLPTPEEGRAHPYSERERAIAEGYRALQYIGDPGQIAARLRATIRQTGADEIMVSSMIHDPVARRRSYQLLAEALSA